jgi:NYN domain
MKVYVYVDGESHFIRSEDRWKKLHGEEADLKTVAPIDPILTAYSYPVGLPPIRLDRRMKFFWDTYIPHLLRPPLGPWPIGGAIYFTDFSGDDNEMHDVRVALRKNAFEPQVIRERNALAKHRDNRLKTDAVLEKPKGLDIGLTVRLLEDGYRHIYDTCYLLTSDVDYIPVIRAIQQLGRKVVVFGYKDGQGSNSELEYVPDQFIDLGQYMDESYRSQPAAEMPSR